MMADGHDDLSDVLGDVDPLRHGRRVSGGGHGGRSSGWRGRLGSGAHCRSAVSSAARRFAVLRVAKIKTLGNLASSAKHTFRQRETPNADPELRGANEVWIGPDSAEGMAAAWAERAPETIRKNAVHALEYLVTASPEALAAMSKDEQDGYFARGLDWLCQRHGEANVLSAVIHRDETTPHLTAMVIPLDERGHLNARSFTGGKVQLSAMQTSFAEAVSDWGIERGIHRSGARHVSIREYYAQVTTLPSRTLEIPEIERGGFLGRGRESPEAYAERLREAAGHQYAHLQRNYDQRLQEASHALSAAKRTAVRQRINLASRGLALEALAAWHSIGEVESPTERREMQEAFATQWDGIRDRLAGADRTFVSEMDARLVEAGVGTERGRDQRLEVERRLERKGATPEEDTGWAL